MSCMSCLLRNLQAQDMQTLQYFSRYRNCIRQLISCVGLHLSASLIAVGDSSTSVFRLYYIATSGLIMKLEGVIKGGKEKRRI